MKYAVLLILIILASGCTTTKTEGLSLRLSSDPTNVLANSMTNIHIDVDNRDPKSIYNVIIRLFDAGILQGVPCEKIMPRMLPFEFQSVTCPLQAPDVDEVAQTEINALVSFDTELSTSQVFEILGEDEHQRRLALGTFSPAPAKYTFLDRNVQIDIEFSEQPPIVIVPEKKYFVYLTVKNIGQGFLSDIAPGDLSVMSSSDIVFCPPYNTLVPTDKVFPRIACELQVPQQFSGGYFSPELQAKLKYNYELRSTLGINVIK